MTLPVRRALEERIVEVEGEPRLVLRDPEGLLDAPVILPPLPALVYAYLDGGQDMSGLQSRLSEHAKGALIPEPLLLDVIAELDRHYLLENGRSAERRREVVESFRTGQVRAPRHVAGDADEIRQVLDGFFSAEGAAGAPDRARGGDRLRGVLAPHIDFARGGTCYTHAYRQVAESRPADTYLVLGVAHRAPPTPFVLSTKHYATAFGDAEVDAEFVASLLKRAGRRSLDHEIVHRTEHSAEFQAVWLKHALGDRPFRIVPILCSSFRSPDDPEVKDFIGALRETIASCDRDVCVVAGVDFAHVGPVFGDDVKVDGDLIGWMADEDGKSLREVVEGDAAGFWASVMYDGDRRHVCGLTATYTALELLGTPGRLLKYGFAPDPMGGIVSFASAVFP